MSGPWCAQCGQKAANPNGNIWSLAGDLMDDLFRLDSRISITIWALLFRPGFLTLEFFKGRRARYTPPLRLYLVISFLFFFLMPTLNAFSGDALIEKREVSAQSDLEVANFDGIDLPWLDEVQQKELDQAIATRIAKIVKLAQQDPTQLYSQMMDSLSAVMFFMLPLFAGFMKLLYLRQKIYYAQHLLLAIHNHCFLFLAMLITALLELTPITRIAWGGVTVVNLIELWIPVYIFLGLRNMYRQSAFVTALKYCLLLMCYLIVSTLGALIALIIGLLMI